MQQGVGESRVTCAIGSLILQGDDQQAQTEHADERGKHAVCPTVAVLDRQYGERQHHTLRGTRQRNFTQYVHESTTLSSPCRRWPTYEHAPSER